MYESPIKIVVTEMETKMEDDMLTVVANYGFTVNKEELTKALAYDRKQYEKGFDDGYCKALDKFKELVREVSYM